MEFLDGCLYSALVGVIYLTSRESYESFDLEIDSYCGTLCTRATKVSSDTNNLFSLGVGISDFRSSSAININSIEDSEYDFRCIDSSDIRLCTKQTNLWITQIKRSELFHCLWWKFPKRLIHFYAMFLECREDNLLYHMSPTFRESERIGKIDVVCYQCFFHVV